MALAPPFTSPEPHPSAVAVCRQELEALIRSRYPNAWFEWGRSPEGDTWVLGAHVAMDDDIELARRVAEREVDFLEERGIAVLTVLVP